MHSSTDPRIRYGEDPDTVQRRSRSNNPKSLGHRTRIPGARIVICCILPRHKGTPISSDYLLARRRTSFFRRGVRWSVKLNEATALQQKSQKERKKDGRTACGGQEGYTRRRDCPNAQHNPSASSASMDFKRSIPEIITFSFSFILILLLLFQRERRTDGCARATATLPRPPPPRRPHAVPGFRVLIPSMHRRRRMRPRPVGYARSSWRRCTCWSRPRLS